MDRVMHILLALFIILGSAKGLIMAIEKGDYALILTLCVCSPAALLGHLRDCVQCFR